MTTADMQAAPLRELAEQSNAWPFEEARKIVARLKKAPKDEVIFETGYGPSGLPHIGTFGEVARTTMVRHAFRVLTEDRIKTRLLAFSDDMDGLRKVPDNVPNKEMLAAHLGKPLTAVPDPFSNEYPSFGAANNARLRAFLDGFGFDYEFLSSSACYRSGRFDEMLRQHLLVRHVVGDLAQPVHVVGERDQAGLDLVVREHAERVTHHGGARNLAKRADVRQARRPVAGLEDHLVFGLLFQARDDLARFFERPGARLLGQLAQRGGGFSNRHHVLRTVLS